MSKLEKYTTYKDSGVEWLGDIPSNWKPMSIKRLITLLTDYTANGSFADLAKNVQYLNEPDYAQLVRLTDIRKGFKEKGVYINEKSYKYLKKSSLFGGELLMANVGAYSGHSFLLPKKLDFNASLAPNMFLIKFDTKQVNNQFIYYGLNCNTVLSRLVLIATSTAQPKLNKDNIKSIFLPLPPKEEQTKIASFLDEKTSQIDKAISQKEKLIELLKERRQIVINEAVTKGLDKDVEFKDSGVEWIGEIPKHWEVSKLGTCLKPISINNRPELSLLSVTREEGVILRNVDNQDSNHNFIPDDLTPYKMVEKGQFAMNKMKAWQGSYGISDYTGIVSPAYYIFELNGIESTFFHKAIRSSVYIPFFIKASDGVRIGQWDLSKSRMKEIPFYIPPTKEEQLKIVEYIEAQTTKIDKAIELQQNYIAKLKEYKASLIDSVVTGKVRVA